jgi:Tol biopolymer transport system component
MNEMKRNATGLVALVLLCGLSGLSRSPLQALAWQAKPSALPGGNELFQKALVKERAEGNLDEAIKLYREIVQKHSSDRALAAKALIQIGGCYEKLGNTEAKKAYQQVINNYADQKESVEEARVRLAAMGAAVGELSANQLKIRRLVGPSYYLTGRCSPDGRYIAYYNPDPFTGRHIVVRELATDREQRLPVKPLDDREAFTFQIRFSPDSKEIAYVAVEAYETLQELRVAKLDGSGERVVFKNPEVRRIALSDWTPDGKHLVAGFTRQDKTAELVLIPVVGGAPRKIRSSSIRGALSPDGKYLAYTREQKDNVKATDIYVFALDGSLDAPLVEHPADDRSIGWTQDGRFLFSSDRTGSRSLWAVGVVDGKPQGTPELLLKDAGEGEPIGLSRNGSYFYHKWIFFSEVYLAEMDPATGRLVSSPAPVSQRETLSHNAPDWSPDGRYLAYQASKPGQGEVVKIRTLATGEEREFQPSLRTVMFLRWFPDNKALAAQGVDQKGELGVHRVEVASGAASVILQRESWGDYGANPTLSPDGKVMTYKKYERERKISSLVQYNIDTREEKVLFQPKPPLYVGSFTLLHRTGQIALSLSDVEKKTGCVKLLEPTGGEPKVIYQAPSGEFIPGFASMDWMPDGRSILITKARTGSWAEAARQSLWRIPLSGGQPEKLFESNAIFDVRVHPSGRWVAIGSRQTGAETWVVENLVTASQK